MQESFFKPGSRSSKLYLVVSRSTSFRPRFSISGMLILHLQLIIFLQRVYRIFGSNRVLGIWNSLKTSPVLTQFRWSQLVETGFLANRHLFSEVSWLPDLLTSAYPYTPIPGLLALHIRRGDFEGHCLHFAKWSSPMNGFNQFPEMPDQFVPPAAAGRGEYTEEGKEIYLRHCFPDIKQIVGRVEQIRATPAGQGLKNIFIMTNAKKPWLQELKTALDEMGGWEKIVSSRDLELDWEQRYIAQAVDMLIGQRAQVIIGNGVRCDPRFVGRNDADGSGPVARSFRA